MMQHSRRRTWFLIRLAFYLTVIAILFVVRGGMDWRRIPDMLNPGDEQPASLVIAGRDLAPELLDAMLVHYIHDYPELNIELRGGGTNQALEDLVNGRADVALLYRRTTPAEQDLFRETDGDTAIVRAIAVSGLMLLAGPGVESITMTLEGLRAFAAGATLPRFETLYAPDPNQGTWDAFCEWLGTPFFDESHVVFLANDAAVVEAVRNDPAALGLASGLSLPSEPTPGDVRAVELLVEAGRPAAAPTYENVADGTYPLHHYLYVVCRTHGGIQGAKFVTHVCSGRGQRQIERAGTLPARQVLREIHLTKSPMGH